MNRLLWKAIPFNFLLFCFIFLILLYCMYFVCGLYNTYFGRWLARIAKRANVLYFEVARYRVELKCRFNLPYTWRTAVSYREIKLQEN